MLHQQGKCSIYHMVIVPLYKKGAGEEKQLFWLQGKLDWYQVPGRCHRAISILETLEADPLNIKGRK